MCFARNKLAQVPYSQMNVYGIKWLGQCLGVNIPMAELTPRFPFLIPKKFKVRNGDILQALWKITLEVHVPKIKVPGSKQGIPSRLASRTEVGQPVT